MPKKSHKKKRAWREGCRKQVRAGLINNPSGGWSTAQGKRCDIEMRDGYRVGQR